MTVTFCGHSMIANSDAVKEVLYCKVTELIKSGAMKFLLGGYGDFDYIAASVVADLKNEYPFIQSILMIPYLNRKYNEALYDYTLYPPIENVPKRYAISKRNEHMVDESDVVIAYVEHDYGGAYYTLKYAKRKKKKIIKIKSDTP